MTEAEALEFLESIGIEPEIQSVVLWFDAEAVSDCGIDNRKSRKVLEALIIIRGGIP